MYDTTMTASRFYLFFSPTMGKHTTDSRRIFSFAFPLSTPPHAQAASECTTEFVVVTTGLSPSTTGAEDVLAVFGPDVAVSVGAEVASEVEGPEVEGMAEVDGVVDVRRAAYGEAEVKGDTAAAAALVVAGYANASVSTSVQGERAGKELTFSVEASIKWSTFSIMLCVAWESMVANPGCLSVAVFWSITFVTWFKVACDTIRSE